MVGVLPTSPSCLQYRSTLYNINYTVCLLPPMVMLLIVVLPGRCDEYIGMISKRQVPVKLPATAQRNAVSRHCCLPVLAPCDRGPHPVRAGGGGGGGVKGNVLCHHSVYV